MTLALKIHDLDTVAVGLEPLSASADLADFGVNLLDDIPRGHKFALRAIAEGEKVLKYGAVIGVATQPIARGAHIHTHNMRSALGEILDYAFSVASGRPTRNEENDIGEIAIFKTGVTL